MLEENPPVPNEYNTTENKKPNREKSLIEQFSSNILRLDEGARLY